jgi:NAD(P)-dependent dehydrogenase (short-subunit alcohol dehydrogenase family)
MIYGMSQSSSNDRRVALLTGAARGIGKGVAAQLIADGFAVVIGDVRGEAAQETAQEFVQAGAHAAAAAIDVTDPAACAAAVQTALDTFGRIDVLVNSAGISAPKDTLEVTPEEWRRMIEIQLNGAFFTAQAVGRALVAQGRGGSIVLISSINAEAAFPRRAAYASAKAGVAMLVKTLAIEWAAHDIRVNAIGPSHTETEMTRANIEKGNIDVASIQRRIPLGRLASVQDVANAVSFLCSDRATYITGQSLYVDGGYLAYGYF